MDALILTIKLPSDYIMGSCINTWRDLDVGLKKGWLTNEVCFYLAKRLISVRGTLSQEEMSVMFLSNKESEQLKEIVEKLSGNNAANEKDALEKWGYLFLKWLYCNRDQYENIFDLISYVYAEVDYPEEISLFVPYMPLPSNAPPLKEGETHEQRLFSYWEQYLQNKKHKYQDTQMI